MIIVIGIAGSGKTTQGKLLARRLGCPWLSTGQLIRDKLADPGLQKKILRGELLSDEELMPRFTAELSRLDAAKNELVLDGFPRVLSQAQWLVDQDKKGTIKLTAIIHLLVSKETVKKRLLTRARSDDTDEAINKRFEKYAKEILPIIDYLKSQAVTIHEIDGEGSEAEIAQTITDALGVQ
ncbi:hypothetical protein A3A68_00755 [Candidatus Saccharibacteria bacterium RIFCSPLOWO2_01_FULL_48_13]|nr:MAG: hypothetical protein A3F38_01075 [Candidatus Saccharibacteria bacterium RIFCSPHIGHO2_12_FULL_48_21]OGL37403.1 MAG: hypothetical protein A3A68_00755 [Candidatus Saccharibacteria bacterium RIFCSPLOWO2_01_FULL_48_13]